MRRYLGLRTWIFLGGLLAVGLVTTTSTGQVVPAIDYGLFNTGVDDQQNVLQDNDQDPHYTLVAPSVIEGPGIVATSKGGFPVGPWLDDDHLSAWIGPTNDTNGPGDLDTFFPNYYYRTTFDLTGVSLQGLAINGEWSSDNNGVDIVLNGASLFYQNTAQFGGYAPFVLESDFVQGINTLEFLVNNAIVNEGDPPGPTGLRVRFEGNGNEKPPPPPPHPNAIASLYATGVDDDRQLLEEDAVLDPHYTIVLGPDGDPMDAVTVPTAGVPGSWFANDSNSRWISPPDFYEGDGANGEPGTYIYQTTFNVTGVDRDNAVIALAYGTDDGGPSVLLNGVEIPNDPSIGFAARSWFGVNSASAKAAGTEILEGINTLTFVVENGGVDVNPTGFRVDDVFARAAPVGTVPIPGLFNTGVGDDQLPLEDFDEDPHYRVTLTPTGDPGDAIVVLNDDWPIPPWVTNTSSSRWIAPTDDPDGSGDPGDYEFAIDFDLTGLDPATAVIQGLWSVDNTGSDILLNGAPTENTQGGGLGSLSAFEISQALGDSFLPGTNTLTFRVNNAAGAAPNPVGLRVEGILAFAMSLGDLTGDYNNNGELDTGDLDLQAIAIVNGGGPEYDLNNDGSINFADREVWVNDLKKTWIGDANLDLEFNSSDMVQVFAKGKYELQEDAKWEEGDWTGDLRFNSGDMVAAFAAGGYEQGQKPAVAASAVPEPSTWALALLAALGCLGGRRRRI